jgi:hypothetical protein
MCANLQRKGGALQAERVNIHSKTRNSMKMELHQCFVHCGLALNIHLEGQILVSMKFKCVAMKTKAGRSLKDEEHLATWKSMQE